MSHWRRWFDSPYVGSWDLPTDRDSIVTIERTGPGVVTGKGGKKDKKAIIHLVGKKKPFAANITNCRTIARLYGNDTRTWTGKSLALYVTTTELQGETVECIRVRPQIPDASLTPAPPPAGPAPDDSDASEPEENDDERQSA